jgi:4-amino-4-deoxy-L-arabinose transferase-like glycosyltransferase
VSASPDPVPESTRSFVTTRRAWFFLFLIAVATLLPGTWLMPLLDRDEPRFSRATVEMEEGGDWLVPHFNGEYRFDKPPLTYWTMHVGYSVFGHDEFGARVHSVAASLLVAAILFAFGRELYGARTGFWAAAGFLTLFQVWQHGRLAVADMPMVAAVTAAHWALWKLLAGEARRKWNLWFWVLWGSLALGFLAKGPIAFFCPLATLLFLRFVFWRRPIEWGRLQLLPGFALCLIPIAVWGIPALLATHGEFWKEGIGKHVVDRGLGAFDDRMTIPVLFYLVTALVSLFPWLGRAGCAWAALRHPRTDMKAAFLASWAVGPYLIFAFYATQLPHYVLPAFPALCIAFFAQESCAESRWGRRWFLIYHGLFIAIILFLAFWLLLGPVMEPVRVMMLGFVGILMGLEFVAVNFEARQWVRLGAGLAMVAAGSWVAAHGMKEVALSPRIAAVATGCEGKFAAVGYTEPSLVYYAGHKWDMFPASPEGLAEAVAGNPEILVVLRKQANTDRMLGFSKKEARDTNYAPLAEHLAAEGYARIELSGLNIARFSWADVDVYRRLDSFRSLKSAEK